MNSPAEQLAAAAQALADASGSNLIEADRHIAIAIANAHIALARALREDARPTRECGCPCNCGTENLGRVPCPVYACTEPVHHAEVEFIGSAYRHVEDVPPGGAP